MMYLTQTWASRLLVWPLIFLVVLAAHGCSSQDSKKTDSPTDQFLIVATTGMIADAASIVADSHCQVQALMGPGVDPHLYKATQGDLQKLTDADLILYNGLHLEGKMGDVFKKLARKKAVVPVAEKALAKELLRQSPKYADAYDPHVWFDVGLWRQVVAQITKELQAQLPQHAEAFQQNGTAYMARLDSLHQAVQTQIATIPESQRILVTAHDAFGYFGDAYDIRVQGLQGISTVSDFGLKDRIELVNLITENRIKAVFVETSVSPRFVEAVVEDCKDKGHEVQIGGYLYSDAMGQAGTPAGYYIGMVNANVQTIVNGLR